MQKTKTLSAIRIIEADKHRIGPDARFRPSMSEGTSPLKQVTDAVGGAVTGTVDAVGGAATGTVNAVTGATTATVDAVNSVTVKPLVSMGASVGNLFGDFRKSFGEFSDFDSKEAKKKEEAKKASPMAKLTTQLNTLISDPKKMKQAAMLIVLISLVAYYFLAYTPPPAVVECVGKACGKAAKAAKKK